MWIADLEALNDEDLVARFVSSGMTEAVDVLLRRHQDRVFAMAYRILGNRADALDAAQEVFVSVFRKASSFRHQSAFTTWLYRLTVNACTDLGRRRSRLPNPAQDVAVATPDGVGAMVERLDIQAALLALPLDQRTAVIMRDLYGASYEEIAQATQAALGTVKSRIARGRSTLAGGLAGPPGKAAGSGEPQGDQGRLSSKSPIHKRRFKETR